MSGAIRTRRNQVVKSSHEALSSSQTQPYARRSSLRTLPASTGSQFSRATIAEQMHRAVFGDSIAAEV